MQRSIAAGMPNSQVRDEDISRTRLRCFMTHAASGALGAQFKAGSSLGHEAWQMPPFTSSIRFNPQWYKDPYKIIVILKPR